MSGNEKKGNPLVTHGLTALLSASLGVAGALGGVLLKDSGKAEQHKKDIIAAVNASAAEYKAIFS